MKNFTLQLIDFGSIEAANDFIPTFDRKVTELSQVKIHKRDLT